MESAAAKGEGRWRRLALLMLILLVEFIVYFPALGLEFAIADDFICIAHASKYGLSLEGLFLPYFGHIIPLCRLLVGLEYRFFGTNPAGYYAVTLLLHMANTALVALFLARFTESWTAGLVGATIFGLSAAHWQPVFNILASNTSLAAFCYLCAILCVMAHIRGASWVILVPAVFLQAGAFFSISYGIEAPLLFYTLYLAYEGGVPFKVRAIRGTRYLLIFGASSLLLLAARSWLRVEPEKDFHLFEPIKLLAAVPRSLNYFWGGVYGGYLKAYTGSWFLNHEPELPDSFLRLTFAKAYFPWTPADIRQAAWIAGVLLLGACGVDWRSPSLRRYRPALLSLLACSVILYLIPIAGRGLPAFWSISGKDFFYPYPLFVLSSRYRYLPGIPLAGVLAILLGHLRGSALRISGPWTGVAFRSVVILILLTNIADVRWKLLATRRLSFETAAIRERFVGEVERKLRESPGPLPIADEFFMRHIIGKEHILPSVLLQMYLEPGLQQRIVYVNRNGVAPDGRFKRFFRVEKDGTLRRVDAATKPTSSEDPRSRQTVPLDPNPKS